MPLPGTDIWGCANRKASSREPGSNTINLSLTQALVVTVTNKTQMHQTISVYAAAGSSFLGARDVCATIHRETLGVGDVLGTHGNRGRGRSQLCRAICSTTGAGPNPNHLYGFCLCRARCQQQSIPHNPTQLSQKKALYPHTHWSGS